MRRILLILLAPLLLTASLALAQEGESHTVAFDGINLTFDPALAGNVNLTRYPGDPAELGFGFAEPVHTQFTFYNAFPVPESIGDAIGGVRVYRTADFEGYEEHENRLAALQSLLEERPDLADFEALHTEDANANALPFIPVYAAAQVIRARTQYIETDEVEGIAYLTIYQEGVEPFERALWTFQGISSDGAYYIAAIFNVTSDVFPADSSDFAPERFNEYRAKMVAWLNEAEPASFAPGLPALEALVESIEIAA
jgi:hypothetical protein